MASSRLPHGALHGPSDVAEATAEAVGEEMVPRTHAGGARSFGGRHQPGPGWRGRRNREEATAQGRDRLPEVQDEDGGRIPRGLLADRTHLSQATEVSASGRPPGRWCVPAWCHSGALPLCDLPPKPRNPI